MKTRHFCTIAMIAIASAVLPGCNTPPIKMCPVASILADTASYPGFREGREGDPAAEAFIARLTSVETDCDFDERRAISDSDVEFTFRATRTPNGDAATYSVPYFVAVTYAGQILTKKTFAIEFSFRPGASTAEFSDSVDSIMTQVEVGKLPYDYQILVGMQLSDAQLNYIKLMGRYTP